MSRTSTDVKRRWNEKHYDRMAILVPKGRHDTIRQFAKEHGISVNGLINELIRYEMGLSKEEWACRAQA